MRKRIGIASEGPTDILVLKKVIDKITGEDNQYLPLQPEPDMMGRYGNGWKGVWKWCKETAPLNVLMDSIQPQIDMIVIQMDGDVVRKEKEVHCWCESTICKEKKSEVFPLYCRNTIERKCPIELPCSNHVNDLKDMIMHGKYVLGKTMGEFDKTKIVNIHGHDHNNMESYRDDCKHINLAANVCDFTPVNLGKLIKEGILADIDGIHRVTIDRATERKANIQP